MSNAIDCLLLHLMKANHLAGRPLKKCEVCEEEGRADEIYPCVACNRKTCDDCQWGTYLSEIESDTYLSIQKIIEKYPEKNLDEEGLRMLFLKDLCLCVECTECDL